MSMRLLSFKSNTKKIWHGLFKWGWPRFYGDFVKIWMRLCNDVQQRESRDHYSRQKLPGEAPRQFLLSSKYTVSFRFIG